MIKSLEKAVFGFSRKMNWVSGIALAIMMGLVFINVVLRTVWRPILGTYDFTALLASITVSFALAHCAAQKGHVAITLFVERLPKRIQGVCGVLVGVLGASLFMVMCWECIKYGIRMDRVGEVTMTTHTPFYPFVYGMAFGFLVLALVSLVEFLTSLKEVVKR
jgi:TRAP-type C4-dicarboxylate transport system permease small subunit